MILYTKHLNKDRENHILKSNIILFRKNDELMNQSYHIIIFLFEFLRNTDDATRDLIKGREC
jgi:hypothetical protein